MKRLLISTALVVAVAAPATAAAKPSKTDKRNAQQECRAERGTTDESREAFRAKYGTGSKGRNAFGKCVSRTAREEQRERRDARRAAKEACREERGTTEESRAAFAEKYGTNRGRGNATQRCVAQATGEMKDAEDAEDREERAARRNAAKACDEERGETEESRAAFAAKYGTNRNRRNAFGRCVSQRARAQGDDRPGDDGTAGAQREQAQEDPQDDNPGAHSQGNGRGSDDA